MRAFFFVLVLLVAAAPALAQSDPTAQERAAARAELEARIRAVQAALGRFSTEQQSIYQQFQMVQEMRRNERQELLNPTQVITPPGSPTNYDDVVRDKQAREYRLQDYANQMDRLYARYRELEEQKRQLLDHLAELAAQR
jgi:chromosome segregation ATPase